jgi:predicted peptidase
MNVKREMYDYSGKNGSHRNSNKSMKSATRSPNDGDYLLLEKYQDEKFCDKRRYNNNNNNIPENKNPGHPKNYRPVTCLPTTYKLLTSIMSRRMQQYVDGENLIPKEQKGCRSGTKGCKD